MAFLSQERNKMGKYLRNGKKIRKAKKYYKKSQDKLVRNLTGLVKNT